MKIAQSPESFFPNPRPSSRGATTSFAQLLERGAEARSVMAHRALGFSETGILGLHFAREQGSGFRATGSADQRIVESIGPSSAQRVTAGTSVVATPKSAGRRAGPAGQSYVAPSVPPAVEPEAPLGGTSERSAAQRTSEQATPEEPCPSPLRPPAPPPTRRRSPLQLRLLGNGAELVVVLEGQLCGDESILELEATARAVASEYCMGISHLFIKPNSSGAAT